MSSLRAALAEHNRALLVAEPGAGNTTRVPLALLDEPWCRGGRLLLEALQRRQRLPFDESAEQLRGRIALLRREGRDDWPPGPPPAPSETGSGLSVL